MEYFVLCFKNLFKYLWCQQICLCFKDLSVVTEFIVYPRHWIDPLISFFRLSVCVSVNRSVVERLRPQFFTDFHEILHAAQKCGRFVAYYL